MLADLKKILIGQIPTLEYKDILKVVFESLTVSVLFVCSITTVLKLLGYYEDSCQLWIVTIVFPFILFILKKTGDTRLAAHMYNFAALSIIGYVVIRSGGIYSVNLKWVFIHLFISLIFHTKKELLFWSVMISLLLIFISIVPNYNIPVATKFSPIVLLIDKLLFLFIFCTFIFLFTRLQSILICKLEEQKLELEIKNKSLEHQSSVLESMSIDLANSNDRLQKFAHHISHDLKAPLRSIFSFIQLIKKDINKNIVSDKTVDKIDIVLTSSVNMHKMVIEMLDYATDHKTKTKFEEIDLNQIMHSVLLLFKTEIDIHKIRVITDTMPKLRVNKLHFVRLFQNLISNGIKYGKHVEHPTIYIQYNFEAMQHIFSFTDNGCGIEPQKQKIIFHSFKQINAAYKGQGLGLAICKGIVEQYNGKIWVDSELNKGSTFYFSIPAN